MSINNLDIKDLLKKFTPTQKRPFLIWRVIYMATIGVLVAGAIFTFSFIYQNIFTTLNNAYSIIILSSELGMDTVDVPAFEKMEKIIKSKGGHVAIPNNLRNIFDYNIIITSTATNLDKQ